MSSMPSEDIALLGVITPASGAGGVSGWIAVKDFIKILATGIIGASDHDINAKIQGATDGSGTGAADLSGYSITEIGNAAVDNKQFMIELKVRALAKLGFTHVQFSIAGANGSAALVCGIVQGVEPKANVPGVSRNAASVVQVVTVKPGD